MASEGTNPGEVLGGKYRVERVIGRGGMGVVVAARHLTLRQAVAIKLLPDDQAKDSENVARFLREARAVGRLKSEHAVRVTDVGRRKNGAPYFVMELLEGEDLDMVVSRGPLPVKDAVDFMLQACEALAEAHALGIVHRDLKPRNLFLTERRDGRRLVKVLDFGLAKPISAYGPLGAALTATTAVLGSPQYMSPEQMRATRDVDFRTDVWSIGVCLYELLTRRMPFEADTVPVLCAMVLKDQPKPVTHHRPEVPEPLALVVAKCLEKDPAARFANVQDLAWALEPFGSSDSRGAVVRISAVLNAIPNWSGEGDIVQPPPPQEETARPPVSGIVKALFSLVIVLGLTGAGLIGFIFMRERIWPEPTATSAASASASASAKPRGPAQATSDKSPLQTESTPAKAGTSAAPPAGSAAAPASDPAPGAPASASATLRPPTPAVPVQSRTPAPAASSADPARRF